MSSQFIHFGTVATLPATYAGQLSLAEAIKAGDSTALFVLTSESDPRDSSAPVVKTLRASLPITAERAAGILRLAQHNHAFWEGESGETPEEKEYILAVWSLMPGRSCYMDAVSRIARKSVKRLFK